MLDTVPCSYSNDSANTVNCAPFTCVSTFSIMSRLSIYGTYKKNLVLDSGGEDSHSW